MVRQAVIVAGGRGERLGIEGELIPKGLMVIGGEQLVPRSVRLLRAAGIEQIVIGTGHLAERFSVAFKGETDVVCVPNDRYMETGSMQTLYATRKYVRADFLLLESDLLYEPRALESVLTHPQATVVLLSHFTYAGDECYVSRDRHGKLVNISKQRGDFETVAGELVGISKVSRPVLDAMCAYWEINEKQLPRMNYEDALSGVSAKELVAVHREDGLIWCEIDTPEHRRRAETLIVPALRKLKVITRAV